MAGSKINLIIQKGRERYTRSEIDHILLMRISIKLIKIEVMLTIRKNSNRPIWRRLVDLVRSRGFALDRLAYEGLNMFGSEGSRVKGRHRFSGRYWFIWCEGSRFRRQ